MNSALIIGIVLIVLGIGLAVVAYMVITSSDEEDDLPEILEAQEPAEAVPSDPEVDAGDEDGSAQDLEPEELDVSPSVEPALMDAPPVQEESEEVAEPELPAESTEPTEMAQPPDLPDAVERIQVATLLRDDVSGKLIIRVGDREYTSPDDLRASPDWIRVEYAASDLAEWIRLSERKTPEEQEIAAEAEAKVVERKPSTMIEQINSILQEMIETSGRSELAVRLIEGPGGMARVLIGVNSYEIAEVPDPEVQELIRQAVASWESTQ